MAYDLARILGWTSIALGALIYVLAVAGVLFAEPASPIDVGAISVLGVCVLFGVLALALSKRPAGETR